MNEFEKNLKRKTLTPSPLSLSSFQPSRPFLPLSLFFFFFFFLVRKTTRPSAPFLSRSPAPLAHAAQLAPPPAQAPLFPFLFFAQSLTGGALPSGSPPTSSPRVSRAPSWPPAVTGRVPHSPAFKSLLQAAMMLGLHSLAIIWQFPILNTPS
jgi:hypothetical protein